jgi:hypothetical protein
MSNWKIKGCPRCGGDTYADRDIDGWHESCILCGYSRDLPRIRKSSLPDEEDGRIANDASGSRKQTGPSRT